MATRRCGICKRAPREDDPMEHIRIGEDWKEGVEPGGYMACSECVGEFRPKVFEKLKAAGFALESVDQVVGNYLS